MGVGLLQQSAMPAVTARGSDAFHHSLGPRRVERFAPGVGTQPPVRDKGRDAAAAWVVAAWWCGRSIGVAPFPVDRLGQPSGALYDRRCVGGALAIFSPGYALVRRKSWPDRCWSVRGARVQPRT